MDTAAGGYERRSRGGAKEEGREREGEERSVEEYEGDGLWRRASKMSKIRTKKIELRDLLVPLACIPDSPALRLA